MSSRAVDAWTGAGLQGLFAFAQPLSTPLGNVSLGATVAFRLRPQSGAHRLFVGPTAKGRSGSIPGERGPSPRRMTCKAAPLAAPESAPQRRASITNDRGVKLASERAVDNQFATLGLAPAGPRLAQEQIRTVADKLAILLKGAGRRTDGYQ